MSKFRTAEISDPRFEVNNLRQITVKSENLKGRGDISIYVPPGDNLSDLPIVLLLHGVYGSHWVWSQKTGIHLKMNEWLKTGTISPMVIAMPSDGLWGDGSAYLAHSTLDYEKWIIDDVVNAVTELIPQTSSSSNLFLAGLSMGGFGALRIGAKHGDRVTAVSGLSSITHLDQMSFFIEEDLIPLRQSNSSDESVLKTMINYRKRLPKIRFDCGSSDPLIDANRILHDDLLQHDIPHIYEENPGSHEWEYWEQHIKETMIFFDGIAKTQQVHESKKAH